MNIEPRSGVQRLLGELIPVLNRSMRYHPWASKPMQSTLTDGRTATSRMIRFLPRNVRVFLETYSRNARMPAGGAS